MKLDSVGRMVSEIEVRETAIAGSMEGTSMRDADKFAVNTQAYTSSWTAERCLTHLHDSGFHHFDLTAAPGFLWPGDMDRQGAAHFRRFLAGHRLRIISLNAAACDLNVFSLDRGSREASIGTMERLIALAGDLGVQGVVIAVSMADAGGEADGGRHADLFRPSLDRLSQTAERAGTQVWVANAAGSGLASGSKVMQLVRAHGDDRIGVVYDVASGLSAGEDPGATLRAIGGRLRLVTFAVSSVASWDTGEMALTGLPDLLSEIGYADWPVLKPQGADPDATLAAGVARLMTAGFGRPPQSAGAT